MSKTFKPGDIVQLKSGGPIMTVECVSEFGTRVSWFVKERCYKRGFEAQALQAATVPEPTQAQ